MPGLNMEIELMASEKSPYSGLTENEAKELHSGFMSVFILFIAIAVVAHLLMWVYKPWF